MKRAIQLKRRLHTLSTLGEAVGAMKSLSAHHFREARRAVDLGRAYREGVEQVVEAVGGTLPAGDGPAGLLVMGAELGLCGAYNAQVVEAASQRRRELGEGPTRCVGRRASTLLRRHGVELTRVYSAPTSVQGLPPVLMDLAEDLLVSYSTERLSSLEIVSNRFESVGAITPMTLRLLPIEYAGSPATPPIRYVGRERLAFIATREFLYVVLYDVLLDALAGEHGARLIATQSAEGWLDQRTEVLRRRLAATRREATTQEMIEIAAGSRARRRDR